MKIKEYLYPAQVISRLKEYRKIIGYRKKYENILSELDQTGKLEEAGFLKKENYLLIGINLNEQLLTYDELTIEPAELRFVSDKLKKYTDFLQKEGILDVISADYERVKTEDYYGYVVQIKFEDSKFNKGDYVYCILYLISLFILAPCLIASLLMILL
jgi:hypothetical protein